MKKYRKYQPEKNWFNKLEPKTKEGCICNLLDNPIYHASDNPHSVSKHWSCPEHGHQDRDWLIHKEKQLGCKHCYPQLHNGYLEPAYKLINSLLSKLQEKKNSI